jgi:hypothetical protein
VVLLLCTSFTIALWHSSLKESMEMNYNVALGSLTMETSGSQFTLHLIENGKGTNIQTWKFRAFECWKTRPASQYWS